MRRWTTSPPRAASAPCCRWREARAGPARGELPSDVRAASSREARPRVRRARQRFVVALLLTLACGPVPGGRLAGEVAPVPADWAGTLGGDRTFCEIESRPADPHS